MKNRAYSRCHRPYKPTTIPTSSASQPPTHTPSLPRFLIPSCKPQRTDTCILTFSLTLSRCRRRRPLQNFATLLLLRRAAVAAESITPPSPLLPPPSFFTRARLAPGERGVAGRAGETAARATRRRRCRRRRV